MKSCPQCGAQSDEADRFCSACGHNLERDDPSSPGDPMVGRTIAGGYLIQELIGVGGMGRVYKGVQNMLGRTVAVKVIHPHLLGDEQTVARFYNEARAASRLNHPESVGIIDFGRTDDGILYLVMEHLAGKDLATVLAEEGPLPFKRICRILRKVLAALGEAHALGVVHRDLKPENIIVQKGRKGDEVVKVVDFGLATIVGPGSSSITSPGLVCGTPDYMSPEQGRGDELDGRSDLYSMGVLLFEMLTDRLPFNDDTPTKVVLRHIHDPVPDPRAVAPQRRIPDSLAEVAMRALAKAPAKRFQSADEMDDAVRRAEESLETRHVSMIECPTCGHLNPMTVRFCGECGTRLTGVVTIPPNARLGTAATAPPPGPISTPASARGSVSPSTRRPLVGRDAELAQLANLRPLVVERPVWMRVLGEPGVGKTRLLSEFALLASGSGDQVVMTGPHPSGAPAPYYAVRALLAGLLDVDETRLPELAIGALVADPLARAGIAEMVEPKGLPGLPGVPRAGAVAAALAAAVRVAAGRARSGNVVLVVDDLARCDTLSRLALTRLVDLVAPAPMLLVTSSAAVRDPSPHPGAMSMVLRGLDNAEAQDFLSGNVSAPRAVSREKSTEPTQRLLLPLYLEQVRALGKEGHEETLPPRLADAVMARLERLDLPSRRLLQAASVLGDSCPIDWLREVAQAGDLAAIETLARLGLLFTISERIEVVHPFVRDLVEASIPAEARKELHARALQVAAGHGAVLEVRAEHAFKAGEPMSALLLLERMGDAAMTRGDATTATLAFRRGLDLARRELLLSGDLTLDRALVTFSRKLGEALEAHGDLAGADGVLREALELAGPRNKERARMLLVLGRVAIKRERRRDAQRLLGQAMESATANDDPRCEAEVQLNLARLRREEGDTLAAANTFRKACELLGAERAGDKAGDREAALASAELEYAETLVEIGDSDLATTHLELALRHARSAGAIAIAARATGVLGTVRELAGDLGRAASLYREAAELSFEAGDADGGRRWSGAAAASDAA